MRFLIVLFVLISQVLQADDLPFLNRERFTQDGYTVEYSKTDISLAREVAQRGIPLLRRAQGKLELDLSHQYYPLPLLASSYEQSLSDLAHSIEQNEAGPGMRKSFGFVMGEFQFYPALAKTKLIEIWDQPELIQRLQAGQDISLFELVDPNGNQHLNYYPEDFSQFKNSVVCIPLIIRPGQRNKPQSELVDDLLKKAMEGLTEDGAIDFHQALSEPIQAGIAENYTGLGDDTFWIRYGLGQYLAYQYMVRRLDWGKASLPYDPDTQGGGYGQDKVNLKLSRSEFEKTIPVGDHTLFLAAGAASEKVFFNIVRKHGEQIIRPFSLNLKSKIKERSIKLSSVA